MDTLTISTLWSIHTKDNPWSTITWSAHLIDFYMEWERRRLLIDFGMLTGSEITKALNYDLPIDPTTNKQLDPQSIDTVIATHTHADHIGRIPMLVGRWFNKTIRMTEQSWSVFKPIMEDSLNVQEIEYKKLYERAKPMRKNYRKNIANPHLMWWVIDKKQHHALMKWLTENLLALQKPFFTAEELHDTTKLIKTMPYSTSTSQHIFNLFSDTNAIQGQFINAGHIFGSSMALITIKHPTKEKVFSILRWGDMGRMNNRIYGEAPTLQGIYDNPIDLLAIETTYWGRDPHPDIHTQTQKMFTFINEIFQKWWSTVIPCFTQTRFQEMSLYLKQAIKDKKLPHTTKIIMDSPLALEIGKQMNMYHEDDKKDGHIIRSSWKDTLKYFLEGWWDNLIFLVSWGVLQWWTVMKLIHYIDQSNSQRLIDFNLDQAEKSWIILSWFLPEWSLWDKITKNPQLYNFLKVIFSAHTDHPWIVDFVSNTNWQSGVKLSPNWSVYLMHWEIGGMQAVKESLLKTKVLPDGRQIIIPSNNKSSYQFTL